MDEYIKLDNEKILVKFNDMQLEILRIGWGGILKKYLDDTNEKQ